MIEELHDLIMDCIKRVPKNIVKSECKLSQYTEFNKFDS